MYILQQSEILSFVRKSIDEVEMNASSMLGADTDNESLEEIIKRSVVEAIIYTHSVAPVSRLEGNIAAEEDYSISQEDDVITVSMQKDMLRLVSFRCSDSEIVITSVYEEDSPEGRMQLNRYTRGTYDSPRLVVLKGKGESYRPVFKYYSTHTQESEPDAIGISLEYIPLPVEGSEQFEISTDLRFAVLNMTVNLVLTAYRETELAALFSSKAAEYMK